MLNRWMLAAGGVASERVCEQPAKQACFLISSTENQIFRYLTLYLGYFQAPAHFCPHQRQSKTDQSLEYISRSTSQNKMLDLAIS